mmetsp:Transcript_5169/g.23078  ORF Transcript_5169/g.23078 Transcript_5169/m.23078 type:complete len:298 (-) Transcript_5169:3117-4010(-)
MSTRMALELFVPLVGSTAGPAAAMGPLSAPAFLHAVPVLVTAVVTPATTAAATASVPSTAAGAAVGPGRTTASPPIVMCRLPRSLEPSLLREFGLVPTPSLQLLFLLCAQLGRHLDVLPLRNVRKSVDKIANDGLPFEIPGPRWRWGGIVVSRVPLLLPLNLPAVVHQSTDQSLDAFAELQDQIARPAGHVQAVEVIQSENIVVPVSSGLVELLPILTGAVLALELPSCQEHHGKRGHRGGVSHINLRRLHALVERDVARAPLGAVQGGIHGARVDSRRIGLGQRSVRRPDMELHGG